MSARSPVAYRCRLSADPNGTTRRTSCLGSRPRDGQTSRQVTTAGGRHTNDLWHHACGKACVQSCFDQMSGPLVHPAVECESRICQVGRGWVSRVRLPRSMSFQVSQGAEQVLDTRNGLPKTRRNR
jgi:hypothetical protein